MSIKSTRAKSVIKTARSNLAEATQQRRQAQSLSSIVEEWAKKKWENRWKHYLSTAPRSKKTPAHEEELGHRRTKLHQGLCKAESSLAIQLRTEKIGLSAFLHARKVPDVVSPACQCGWRHQDPEQVVISCPERARHRRRLYDAAGTDRYHEILSTGKGAPRGGQMGHERGTSAIVASRRAIGSGGGQSD